MPSRVQASLTGQLHDKNSASSVLGINLPRTRSRGNTVEHLQASRASTINRCSRSLSSPFACDLLATRCTDVPARTGPPSKVPADPHEYSSLTFAALLTRTGRSDQSPSNSPGAFRISSDGGNGEFTSIERGTSSTVLLNVSGLFCSEDSVAGTGRRRAPSAAGGGLSWCRGAST